MLLTMDLQGDLKLSKMVVILLGCLEIDLNSFQQVIRGGASTFRSLKGSPTKASEQQAIR